MKDLELAADDGLPLAATWFPGAGPGPQATVVIASATGVLRRYYRRFARHLSTVGFDAVTFDYRGIGGSKPPTLRGFEATLTDWAVKDIEGIVRKVRNKSGKRPIFLVGHSIGGQILGLIPSVPEIRAAVLITTQSAYWCHWRGFERLKMWSLWHVFIPGITRLVGYLPAKRLRFSENLPKGAALEWAYWGRHPDYLLRVGDRRATYAGLAMPIQAFSFTDDHYAPKRSVLDMLSRFAGADLEHLHLSPGDVGDRAIGHFGFFRERFRNSLWAVATDWLQRQI